MLAFERCLCDLVRLLTPSPSQIEDKMHVLKDVRVALSSIGFTADIYGSLCTGLLTPSSDMDCVVVPSPTAALHGNAQAVRQVMAPVLDSSAALGQQERKSRLAAGIRAVANAMRRSRDFNDVRAIVHARVPIVKCRHRAEGLGVDLSFEQDGCRSSFFLCNEFRKDENVLARSLIVLVKSLVSNEGLDDPSVGGLGSFPISLMVLWYIKSEVVKHYRENLRNNLAVVLVGVLKYYGDDLDFRRVGIDYVRAVTFQKPMSNELLIMNPIKAGSNCAAAASLFASRVVPLFSDAAAAFGELLTPSASMSRAEASLDRFYHNMMSRCDDYGRRGGREGHQQQQQHIWDKQTNVYVGGVLPAFYNH